MLSAEFVFGRSKSENNEDRYSIQTDSAINRTITGTPFIPSIEGDIHDLYRNPLPWVTT